MKTFHSTMPNQQRGAALIILAVIIILTVSLIVVSKMGRNGDTLQRNDNVNKLLAEARDDLVAFAVTNQTNPGMLPYPDRNNDPFNGWSDCNGGVLPVGNDRRLLIGQIPFLGQEAAGAGCNLNRLSLRNKHTTYPLHYVVSANLVEYLTTPPPARENLINANVVNFNDGNILNNAENWLTVFDNNGNVLSDRVAFIIFYPGSALTTSTGYVQDRIGNTPGSAEFLESVNVPVQGLINNADATDSRFVKGIASDTFNDKLVYMTAEDLMRRVEDRMLRVASVRIDPNSCDATMLANAAAFPALTDNWLGPITSTNTYNTAIGNNDYVLRSITYDPPESGTNNNGGGNGNGNNGNGNGNGGGNGNGNNGNGNGNGGGNGNNGNAGNGNNGNGNGNNGNNGNNNPVQCTPGTPYAGPYRCHDQFFNARIQGIFTVNGELQCAGVGPAT